MARIKTEVTFNTKPLQKLIQAFPDLAGGFLALVGKRGRTYLKEQLLSGQELNVFTNDPSRVKGKSGKLLITSDVNRKRTQVKIYSFPVNLFERGRGLRSGAREAGKYIITRKLKQAVSAGMAGYVNEFENRFVKKAIRGAEL